MTGKPTVEDLGIEVDAQQWQRSGDGEGSLEVAFVPGAGGAADWVLMRVAGDPQGRILVYDRHVGPARRRRRRDQLTRGPRRQDWLSRAQKMPGRGSGCVACVARP
jgi:hypothetical protein